MSERREGGTGTTPGQAGSSASPRSPVTIVVADDLIWSTRLGDALRRVGAEPRTVRSTGELAERLLDADGCIVDLTARAYDGVAAVATASRAGVPVIAVGQHDDAPLRRAATDAGAARVYAYRRLFEHGDADLAGWVDALAVVDRGTATRQRP